MSKQIVNHKRLQNKSRGHEVEMGADFRHYWVTSCKSGKRYSVDLPMCRCSCEWGQHKARHEEAVCSHVMAAKHFETTGEAYFWGSEAAAKRQHDSFTFMGDNVWSTVTIGSIDDMSAEVQAAWDAKAAEKAAYFAGTTAEDDPFLWA